MIDITGLREDKRQQSSAIVHALIDRLEAAEKSRDDLLACLGEWLDKTKWVQQGSNEGTISAKYIGLHRADVMARLLDEAEKERDALRAKLAEMEKQEPLDAGSDVFRSAFEAALKAGNWPATRQGDGYRSPSTQIAWRIAFSTVNRLKLYISPGAQGE